MDSNTRHLLATKFNLPLFMTSRIRFKESQTQDKLEAYITRNKNLYLQSPQNANADEIVSCTIQNYQHLPGIKTIKPQGQCASTTKSIKPVSSKEKSWQLPPNIYNINKIPFERHKGQGGAYWRKLRETNRKILPAKTSTNRFYNLPRETEKFSHKCHKQKGLFLSNARERRATERGLISNPLTCFKDPKFPAPNAYLTKEPTTKYKKPPSPNPHIFHRNSIVPIKKNKIHSTHQSFSPGPGRYETQYRNVCPCSGNLIYQPELQLIIDKNKRLKFRHLPYNKIKTTLYCSPDFRHVKNAGNRHLFQGAKREGEKTIKASDDVKKPKELQLYADFKYISMINNATSPVAAIRKQPQPQLPPRIVYNSMIKVIKRKQLRINKKIAFSSGVQRWKDGERPKVLTARQLEELKAKLPRERQLRDYPVMTKDKDDIVGKLKETPKHMMPSYVPKLRKRLFKFLPLPAGKILVNDADTKLLEPVESGYYCQTLEAKEFFKNVQ